MLTIQLSWKRKLATVKGKRLVIGGLLWCFESENANKAETICMLAKVLTTPLVQWKLKNKDADDQYY